MSNHRWLPAVAVVVVLLSGCSGGSDSATSSSAAAGGAHQSIATDDGSIQTLTDDPTTATSAEASTPAGSGDQSDVLGATATISDDTNGSSYTITVSQFDPKVTVPYEDQKFLCLNPATEHWARLKARVCATGASAPVNWFEFAALTADGDSYAGLDNSFHDPFPKPLLPDNAGSGIPAGPCRQGWVYLPVNDGATITAITYTETVSNASMTWTL